MLVSFTIPETNMLLENTNTNVDNLLQHESYIRQLKTDYLLMKIKPT